jgi:hypothetical protein
MTGDIRSRLSARDQHQLQVQRGRMGGLKRSAMYDPVESTKAARAAFLNKFELEADPEGQLPPAERARRATALRKLHFSRLAYRSSVARSARQGRGRP